MPQRAKKAHKSPPQEAVEEAKSSPEPGQPDPGSIVGEEPFTSPSGAQYRIFHTDETDPYEEPKPAKPHRRRSAKPSS